MQKYRQIIEILDSPEWQQTRTWLREFLQVQAMYSDEEIENLRANAAKMSPAELMDLLRRIEQKHTSMIWMHNSSQRNRQATLAARDQYVKQAAQQMAAQRTSTVSSRPLFGNTQAAAARRSGGYHGYQVPPPLVTSRDVARGSVWSSAVPGWGWGW